MRASCVVRGVCGVFGDVVVVVVCVCVCVVCVCVVLCVVIWWSWCVRVRGDVGGGVCMVCV